MPTFRRCSSCVHCMNSWPLLTMTCKERVRQDGGRDRPINQISRCDDPSSTYERVGLHAQKRDGHDELLLPWGTGRMPLQSAKKYLNYFPVQEIPGSSQEHSPWRQTRDECCECITPDPSLRPKQRNTLICRSLSTSGCGGRGGEAPIAY